MVKALWIPKCWSFFLAAVVTRLGILYSKLQKKISFLQCSYGSKCCHLLEKKKNHIIDLAEF